MARLFDDGNSEYLEINSAAVAAVPLTLAAWFYTDDDAAISTLLWVGDKDVEDNWHSLSAIGVLGGDPVGARSMETGDDDFAVSTTGFTVNTWHHACGVFAANNDRRAFIDGGSKGTNVSAITPVNLDRTAIGRHAYATPDYYMSGRIAEAAIWNVALTDDEVRSLAGGVSPTRIRPESLVAYWPLYGVGSPEPDYRGVYNLTLFSGDSGPVQADHAPVQPPFGFDLGPAGIYSAIPVAVRIPRPPAAYNTLAVY